MYIDDFFPCTGSYGGPAFTRANGNEIWVLILEKAWAKIHGSYERIEAGLCRDAFRDLTGAPTKSVLTEAEDHPGKINPDLIRQLEIAFNKKNKFLLTAGTVGDDEDISASS